MITLKFDIYFDTLLNLEQSEDLIKTFYKGEFTLEKCEAPLRKLAHLVINVNDGVWRHLLKLNNAFSEKFQCTPTTRIFLNKQNQILEFAKDSVNFDSICKKRIKFTSTELLNVLMKKQCEIKVITIYYKNGLDIFYLDMLPREHNETVQVKISQDGCELQDLSCNKINIGISYDIKSLEENIIKCTLVKPMHRDNELFSKVQRFKQRSITSADYF